MRIMFACGGTAGHINPALTVAKYIKRRRPSAEILFVGAVGGMEEKLVPAAGFRLKTIRIRGFLRSFSPKAVAFNLGTLRFLLKSFKAADALIDEFRPDVIVGTGGFAGFPPVYRGAKRDIPTLIHESNALPGKTNIALGKYADKILLGFADSEKYFKQKDKIEFSGNPLPDGVTFMEKSAAKAELNINDPLVYSFWGSLGASVMNKLTAQMLAFEARDRSFTHIHSTGIDNHDRMLELIKAADVDLRENRQIDIRPYVYNYSTVMAAADLVLCRAGAMTISELAASGTPAIIVPSPYVAEDHQRKNARLLSDVGAAVFIDESECTAKKLYDTVKELLSAPDRLRKMGDAARSLAVFDATEHISRAILSMVK